MTATYQPATSGGLGRPAAGDRHRLPVVHDALAQSAADRRLLDVSYRTLDTPVGSLLLAATEAGLVRVGFEREDLLYAERPLLIPRPGEAESLVPGR